VRTRIITAKDRRGQEVFLAKIGEDKNFSWQRYVRTRTLIAKICEDKNFPDKERRRQQFFLCKHRIGQEYFLARIDNSGLNFDFFYIFNKRTPQGCCIPLKSREN
jgi:hypothetical protein